MTRLHDLYLEQGQSPWLDNFYLKYATASGGWCDADGCLTTPTYNHMWFVAYLILYTLALIPLIPLLRRAPKALAWVISGAGLVVWSAVSSRPRSSG